MALLWNLLGLFAIMAQMLMSQEAIDQLPQAQQDLMESTPKWVNLAAVTAVVFGVVGCVGMLLRKRWSIPTLGLSLAGVLAQQSWMHLMSDTFEVMGPSSWILPTLVLVISMGLLGLSILAGRRNWLT